MAGPQGENAWVFVSEEVIPETVKAFFKFEKELFDEAKKVAPKNTEVKSPTSVSCAVMSGRYLTPTEVSFGCLGRCVHACVCARRRPAWVASAAVRPLGRSSVHAG